jgi:hypothetical protein
MTPDHPIQICRECSERPEGCWKAMEYGCQCAYKKAESLAVANADCPLGKLGRTIHLPSVKTFVYTVPWNRHRQERVRPMLDRFGFTDWQFFTGRKTQVQWRDYSLDTIDFLRNYDPPLLIMEDDISPRDWQATIRVPPGAQLAMLGGICEGISRAVRHACENFPNVKHSGHTQGPRGYRYGYAYSEVNGEWMRVYGMLAAHAQLWLDKKCMLEAADKLSEMRYPIDTTFACEQWRWQVICRKVPIFWQDDGHHYFQTFSYEPKLIPDKPESRMERVGRIRQERHSLVRAR